MAFFRPRRTDEEEVFQDLLYLAQHVDILLEVAGRSADVSRGTGSTGIVKHVTDKLGKPDVDVERILGTLQNLRRLIVRTRSNPAQVMDSMLEQFEQMVLPEKRPAGFGDIKKFKEVLVTALNSIGPDHPLEIAKKAERLFYSHQNTLIDAKILTDLRPVFDQAGENVQEGIVTQSIILDYHEGGYPKKLEIALDTEDLENLWAACERAQRKAVSLRDELKNEKWPVKLGPDE